MFITIDLKMPDLHKLSSYDFTFDESLIAKYPHTPRDESRLMIVDRSTGNLSEIMFKEISHLLGKGDALVFNDTKVIPARLIGKRESGGEAEIFLLKEIHTNHWRALVRPGKKLPTGSKVIFGNDLYCEINKVYDDGSRSVTFYGEKPFEELLERYGQIPLPQYMKRAPEEAIDSHRYQTVYAKNRGAVAAPTAGLHFTDSLLNTLTNKGVNQHHLTLHVGLGTFKPVQVEDVREHEMHSETCHINEETAATLNQIGAQNKIISVGTTTCRTLESAARKKGVITPGSLDTDIFIYPGYDFKFTRALLTNFHLPKSTLLMLVSAFAGHDLIMEAYSKAVKEKYRFFSYGDAMLIL